MSDSRTTNPLTRHTRGDALRHRFLGLLYCARDCTTSAPVYATARLLQEVLAAGCCGGYSEASDKRPKNYFPYWPKEDRITRQPENQTTFRVAVLDFWLGHLAMQVGIGIAGCACPLNMPAPCCATAAAHTPAMAALYGAGWLWAGSLSCMVFWDVWGPGNASEKGAMARLMSRIATTVENYETTQSKNKQAWTTWQEELEAIEHDLPKSGLCNEMKEKVAGIIAACRCCPPPSPEDSTESVVIAQPAAIPGTPAAVAAAAAATPASQPGVIFMNTRQPATPPVPLNPAPLSKELGRIPDVTAAAEV